MEERIIDDEYGRGIRLKKTKDGFVDVTDELAQNESNEEDVGEEIAFEFPVLETDEDDEDLVGLSPEEAAALRKKKEEEIAKRKADYERTCKEGDELLSSGSFKAAELKFEKALELDDEATEASVGYWRAKTADFTDPDVLIAEYADAGIESLEYDLGLGAVDIVKKEYESAFRKRVEELGKEEAALAAEIEEKQASRREILSARLKKSTIVFLAVAVPLVVFVVLAIVFGLQNLTTREDTFVAPTIVFGALAFIAFIAFIIVTNKRINDGRIYRANERLSSTEEGRRLIEIRNYKELYECLLPEENA